MLAVLHDQNLVDNEVFLGLLFQVHLLDSNAFVRADLVGGKDSTRSTLPNLVQIAVSQGRVSIGTDGIEFGHNVWALTLSCPLSRSRCGDQRELVAMEVGCFAGQTAEQTAAEVMVVMERVPLE